ncbi:hypothetical protein DY000_02015150 [Brassica cretica]|uniref:Uncharacterized protein n=1 Tax=Brassica cretica TaxID=69181 RepID=A0ABQ7CXX8_BRACR|nr:hypothetical protein DY000_02015150 [Brassica cretica]
MPDRSLSLSLPCLALEKARATTESWRRQRSLMEEDGEFTRWRKLDEQTAEEAG